MKVVAKKTGPRNLRQQVDAERWKKNAVFFGLTGLVLIYLCITLLVGDNGLFKYWELRKTKTKLDSEITGLEKQNTELKKQVNALKNDPYYIEKSAREEYGLARKNELIFQFEDPAKK